MPYSDPKELSSVKNSPYPIWIYLGGWVLAVIAGYVNVLMLEFYSVPVSHMTGAISHLSIEIGRGLTLELKWIAMILVGFLVGAICSGFIIGNPKLKAGRRYGIALMLEGFLLSLAAYLSQGSYRSSLGFAAMACGLQNGMASSYYGLILRTTHVTGIITDIGVLIGQWLKYRKIIFSKLAVLFTIVSGFFIGGVMAMMLYPYLSLGGMYLAALATFVGGLLYFSYISLLKRT